jgi:hypothetical protein
MELMAGSLVEKICCHLLVCCLYVVLPLPRNFTMNLCGQRNGAFLFAKKPCQGMPFETSCRTYDLELPKSLQEMQESLATFDTKFLRCRQRDLSLTVYKCKPNKSVCNLSTLHHLCSYGPSPKKLPETVAFYNNTKYGVDIFDSMARKYTTKTGSRRWPMHCFYNLLDICVINSWILFKLATGSQMSWRAFLLRLGEVLCRFGQTAHSISHIANSHETSSTLK